MSTLLRGPPVTAVFCIFAAVRRALPGRPTKPTRPRLPRERSYVFTVMKNGPGTPVHPLTWRCFVRTCCERSSIRSSWPVWFGRPRSSDAATAQHRAVGKAGTTAGVPHAYCSVDRVIGISTCWPRRTASLEVRQVLEHLGDHDGRASRRSGATGPHWRPPARRTGCSSATRSGRSSPMRPRIGWAVRCAGQRHLRAAAAPAAVDAVAGAQLGGCGRSGRHRRNAAGPGPPLPLRCPAR
jgi:hypothetical protein